MSPSLSRFAPGAWVLVTGANGYIASHVIDVLLEKGYRVRGTVRVEKPWLNQYFDQKYGKGNFETRIVATMNGKGAWDDVVKGVAGVIHMVAIVTFDNPNPEEVIPVVVDGTINMLEAAAKEPSVKSVVLASSSTAALVSEPNIQRIVDESQLNPSTWNDEAVRAAWSLDAPADKLPYTIYAASKTKSERESWEWIKEHEPHYAFNAVLPNMNLGQILHPEIGGSTMAWVRRLLDGDNAAFSVFPPQYFVDVRDDAYLHVAALLDPSVESERLFAFAEEYNWTDIVGILRKLCPDNTKIPDPPENEGRDLSTITRSKRAETLIKDFFGVAGWTRLEQSLEAGIADLRDLRP